MARICLVSTVHPWMNPRLIKEADLFASAGHDVTAVTKCVDPDGDTRDRELLASRPWRAVRVNLMRHDPEGARGWLAAAVRSAAARRAYRLTRALRFAEHGYCRGFGPLLAEAVTTRADLFIAHTQGALPIAARAAAQAGHGRFAFDCEDLLAEEAADGLTAPDVRRAILDIERAYLPRAAYVTATSRAMARHLADRYGIAPHVVYNVFPRAEADRLPPPWQRRRRDTIELVWLSATIGGGRGLDDAVCALAKLPAHVRLTIVGRMLPGYEPRLRALVADAGVGSRVSQHPPVAPCAIFAALGGFDVGLALERDDSANRRLTITNKLFQYLQAGLLVAATGTDGQREVLDAEPAIGFVYPPGDVDALAARLMTYVTNRQALARAQAAAWDAGRARYCWERTSGVLLDAVAAAGIRPTPAPAIAAS